MGMQQTKIEKCWNSAGRGASRDQTRAEGRTDLSGQQNSPLFSPFTPKSSPTNFGSNPW